MSRRAQLFGDIDSIMDAEQLARISAALWGVGALVGVLGIALPHGPHVRTVGWGVLTTLAGALALWTWKMGVARSLVVQYVLSAVALAAVASAVLCAHGAPIAYAVSILYILATIYTASFYPTAAFVVFLVVQAITSALVEIPSGVPGSLAAWAVTTCMTSTVGTVVHVQRLELARAAVTDPLTGLVNRRGFEPLLTRELAHCARFGHPLCVAVIDLDGFKAVNDELGHHAGDRLLVELTAAWQRELRASDVLARAGGDEFVLMLPSTDVEHACAVLSRLATAGKQGFSSGVAAAAPGDTTEDILRRADDACYRAKQTGRGKVVVGAVAG